jgi:carbon storage regulator CsrA
MLVLTRKHQEKIRIGDNITITILKTKGKAVRVGIEAPANIAVVRGELVANGMAPVQAEAELDVASSETVPLARRNRQIPVQPVGEWTTKSHPHSESATRRRAKAEVSLQRVPRGNVNQVLPGLIGAAGPLRSMLEQRATI